MCIYVSRGRWGGIMENEDESNSLSLMEMKNGLGR